MHRSSETFALHGTTWTIEAERQLNGSFKAVGSTVAIPGLFFRSRADGRGAKRRAIDEVEEQIRQYVTGDKEVASC